MRCVAQWELIQKKVRVHPIRSSGIEPYDMGENKTEKLTRIEFEATSVAAAKARVTRELKKDPRVIDLDLWKEGWASFDRVRWEKWSPDAKYIHREGYRYASRKTEDIRSGGEYYLFIHLVWQIEE